MTLRRSGPPERRSELRAYAPLQRYTELPRPSTPLPRSESLTRSELSRGGGKTPGGGRGRPGLDRDLSALVRRRDGGCVGCGAVDVGLEVHHRRRKGMGGSKLLDHPANLICLCGWGNTLGCHAWAHRFASTHSAVSGLIVPEGETPAEWPVRYAPSLGGGWWLLDDDGTRVRTDDPTGGSHARS